MKVEKITRKEFEALPCRRVEYLDRNREYFDNMSKIAGLNPKDIFEIFGKHNFTYRGEFFVKAWAFKFKSEHFFLFSANYRGTTFESTTSDLKLINEFVHELFFHLLKHQISKL